MRSAVCFWEECAGCVPALQASACITHSDTDTRLPTLTVDKPRLVVIVHREHIQWGKTQLHWIKMIFCFIDFFFFLLEWLECWSTFCFRYAQFYSQDEFCHYNMFNHHCFDGEVRPDASCFAWLTSSCLPAVRVLKVFVLAGLQLSPARLPQGARRGEGGPGGRPPVRGSGQASGQELLSDIADMEATAGLWSVARRSFFK